MTVVFGFRIGIRWYLLSLTVVIIFAKLPWYFLPSIQSLLAHKLLFWSSVLSEVGSTHILCSNELHLRESIVFIGYGKQKPIIEAYLFLKKMKDGIL